MSVAWAVGAWANNSWLGMNAGPPNAWRGSTAPVATVDESGAGSLDWLKSRKKKKVIRYSDLEAQEAYAKALAESSIPMSAVSDTGYVEPEDDFEDDDAILLAITRILQ